MRKARKEEEARKEFFFFVCESEDLFRCFWHVCERGLSFLFFSFLFFSFLFWVEVANDKSKERRKKGEEPRRLMVSYRLLSVAFTSCFLVVLLSLSHCNFISLSHKNILSCAFSLWNTVFWRSLFFVVVVCSHVFAPFSFCLCCVISQRKKKEKRNLSKRKRKRIQKREMRLTRAQQRKEKREAWRCFPLGLLSVAVSFSLVSFSSFLSFRLRVKRKACRSVSLSLFFPLFFFFVFCVLF